jgi:3-(3-hydroxy-phenyl)propionate hydroxylase
MRALPETADIVIAGAGPVGLLLANQLGSQDLSVVVLEERTALIDYPRGVGMDDECLRAFQAAGLIAEVLPHTTPNHYARFVNGRGRVFASIEPQTDEFGFARRNAFIQPLIDQVLAAGLNRYAGTHLRLGEGLRNFSQDAHGVTVETNSGAAIRAKYLVGCDGGKSMIRKALGVAFEGKTDANRWIVVDVANDPLGRPNAYLHADPARPFVSIALPHGIRRFEFMLFPGEGQGDEVPHDILQSMLAKVVPDPARIDLIRARVYTHNSRMAKTFKVGRVLLAGDAAHVMPVWQGQGYNSGIRDAFNLGWKLARAANGSCGDALLETFDTERREHAGAMIALSNTTGKILSVRNPVIAALRDAFTYAANLAPPVKNYFLEMRYKPMPRYKQGALDYGPRGFHRDSPVGRMFIQPLVTTADGQTVKLDDVIGRDFALLAWGTDPGYWLSAPARDSLRRLGTRVITAVPETQRAYEAARLEGVTVIGDAQGRLKKWFSGQPDGVIFLRPDRFVAATCIPQDLNECIDRVARACCLLPDEGARGRDLAEREPAIGESRTY